MKKRIPNFLIVALVLITFAAGYTTSLLLNPTKTKYVYYENNEDENTANINDGDKLKLPVDLQRFWEVWETIDQDYVEPGALNEEKALYGAIKGMVKSLDDSYTVFMDPTETKEFQQSLDGKLEGIGAELTVEDKQLVVISPLKDSPAEKAGLLPQDVIYKIDGKFANEMTLFEAIMSIRGKKGTEVVLTILRETFGEPFDVTITRGNINIESVTYELMDGQIAYISINQFSDRTERELSAVISQLLLDKAEGVIIDLRYNGGGYLEIAVDITSELIDGEERVVNLKRRNTEENKVYLTNDKARIADLPLVVLINQGSASASEIVAGAVQDYDRGFVIGEQSFGKGTVQEVIKLRDGSSLRMTIAKWLTAEGRDIDEIGITPDMLVRLTEDDIADDKDPQLEAALEYMKNLVN